MICATKNDKHEVIKILSGAFDDNLSVNYIIKQDFKRKERIRALMDYSFEVCYRFGQVWLSEDREACALVLYPHRKTTTFYSIWLDIKLILSAVGIGGIKKTLDRESKIKAKQPKKPLAYLWFIGVSLLCQHRGAGGQLLKEVVTEAEQQGLPVYLETSTERNLPWYEKHGFTSYDTLDLTYTLHFLSYDNAK